MRGETLKTAKCWGKKTVRYGGGSHRDAKSEKEREEGRRKILYKKYTSDMTQLLLKLENELEGDKYPPQRLVFTW